MVIDVCGALHSTILVVGDEMTKQPQHLRIFIFLIFFFCTLAVFVIFVGVIFGNNIVLFIILLIFNITA